MNPSILPSIYPQWWYCTSFEIAHFAHHSSHNPFTWILPPIYTYTHIFVLYLSLLTTNVWHKIILIRFGTKECWYLLKLLKIELPMFIVSTIGLLLQMHNTRCNLHIYPSIVEILQNSIWKIVKPCFLKEINIWPKNTNIFENPKKM
jgi:hypothetical protein